MESLIENNLASSKFNLPIFLRSPIVVNKGIVSPAEESPTFYLATGITENDVVFAYSPKTATSLENSYLNLVRNTHTLSLSPDSPSPEFISNVGWKFSNDASLSTGSLDISSLYTILILTTINFTGEFTTSTDFYFADSYYYEELDDLGNTYKDFQVSISTGDTGEAPLLPVIYSVFGFSSESSSSSSISKTLSIDDLKAVRVLGISGDGLYINGELATAREAGEIEDIIAIPYMTFGQGGRNRNVYTTQPLEEYPTTTRSGSEASIIQAIVLYNKTLTASQILEVSNAMINL